MRCRRIAAHAIFAGLRIFWRYVPTHLNVADGPSRGQRWPGVLPPPAHAKWQQRCAAVLAGRHARREAAAERELQAKLEAAFGPTDPSPPLLLRPPRGPPGSTCPRFLPGCRCALR